MDVDILSVSAQGTERHSDDSDIEVIACYRHVPIAPTDCHTQDDHGPL